MARLARSVICQSNSSRFCDEDEAFLSTALEIDWVVLMTADASGATVEIPALRSFEAMDRDEGVEEEDDD
jgi:hypothetical protein